MSPQTSSPIRRLTGRLRDRPSIRCVDPLSTSCISCMASQLILLKGDHKCIHGSCHDLCASVKTLSPSSIPHEAKCPAQGLVSCQATETQPCCHHCTVCNDSPQRLSRACCTGVHPRTTAESLCTGVVSTLHFSWMADNAVLRPQLPQAVRGCD